MLAGSGCHCFSPFVVFGVLLRSDRTFPHDGSFSNALLAFVVTPSAATISRAFAYEMWLPVAAASSFVLPATLLLVYVVTAVLGAHTSRTPRGN
jgi:cytochrome c oxidase subunit IV